MNFAEVIKGLQEGKNYTRYSAPHFVGKVITMQIPPISLPRSSPR